MPAAEDSSLVIYRLLRPLLFQLDPERAHALSLTSLRLVGALPPLAALVRASLGRVASRDVEAFGLRFPNAVGLAAGYDKDGLALRGLASLGFGHVEIGTVTPCPQPGNPRPRLFRLAEDRSLINRLGFPSRGADFVTGRLRRKRSGDMLLGVNIGKQRETPLDRAADDYETLMECFAPLADYLVINISSPNTPDLRRLHEPELLVGFLARLAGRREVLRERLEKPVPLLVKISPDLSDDQLRVVIDAIGEAELDGIVATNTTTARPQLGSAASREKGGLSGAALTDRSTRLVERIVRQTGGRLPVIASGGVMKARDARAKLDAGATLVQIYTGLVYEGPALVQRILSRIA